MKTCKYCGRENDNTAGVCIECGTDEFKTQLMAEQPPPVIAQGTIQNSPGETFSQGTNSHSTPIPKKFPRIVPMLITGMGFFFLYAAMKEFTGYMDDLLASARDPEIRLSNVKLGVA